MNLFIKIFGNWLEKENTADKKRGFRGLNLSTYSVKPADLVYLLLEEMEILSHLVLLNHKDLESKYWLERYTDTLVRTDSGFTRFMK